MQSNRLLHQEIAYFFQLLEETEPRRCMFDLFGRCDAPPVNGHFIQEGLLKLLRSRDKEKGVKPFYNFSAEDLSEMNIYHSMRKTISTRAAARRPFLCDAHEGFFSDIENPRPNWDDPIHLLKLAYRSCRIEAYIKKWYIGVGSKVPGLAAMARANRQQLSLALSLSESIRHDLKEEALNEMRHCVAYINCRPTIAATGVIAHPPMDSFLYSTWNYDYIPVPSSPIVITVLPERGRQVVLFSYRRDGLFNATDLLEDLEYANETISTGKLSKKIIEEMELIHISPDAWEKLGEVKQSTILSYWRDSIGTSENELTISPHLIDLFRVS